MAANFTLKRTVVVLRGGGEWGRGEEVDYDPAAQERFQARRGELPFVGRHTLDSFSLLQAGQTEYRRWAFESAALDLALRQAGLSLADALGRPVQPLRFVVSTRSTAVEQWLSLAPELRFKLDPDRDWSDEPDRAPVRAPAASTPSTSRGSTAPSSARRPTRSSTRESLRPSRARGSRIPR